MNNLEFLDIFTEEDIAFNRKMVDLTLELQNAKRFPEKRGGKMQMKNRQKSGMFEDRDYDFSSEVLGEFRRKWGIPE